MKVEIHFEDGGKSHGFKIDRGHALYQHNKTVFLVKVDESNYKGVI